MMNRLSDGTIHTFFHVATWGTAVLAAIAACSPITIAFQLSTRTTIIISLFSSILTAIAAVSAILALVIDRERAARKARADGDLETIRRHEIDAARQQAANANKRVAELESKAKPRRIEGVQRIGLIDCLMNGPKGPVFVLPKAFDEEAEAFASDISEILEQAGFELLPWKDQRPMSLGVSEAFIWVKDMADPPPHAIHIQTCFSRHGIILNGHANFDLVKNHECIIIGVPAKL